MLLVKEFCWKNRDCFSLQIDIFQFDKIIIEDNLHGQIQKPLGTNFLGIQNYMSYFIRLFKLQYDMTIKMVPKRKLPH